MRLLRYGILMGVIVLILFLAGEVRSFKEGNLFLKRLYLDEMVTSAAVDALSCNEDIFGISRPEAPLDRFKRSMETCGTIEKSLVTAVFLDRDRMYYLGEEGGILEKEYSNTGNVEEDVKGLLWDKYEVNLKASPFAGNSRKIRKECFVAVVEIAGEKMATIGGAVRRRKKGYIWNNP